MRVGHRRLLGRVESVRVPAPGARLGVDLQVLTTVDPTVLSPDIADISATLRALGVRGHVLQQVHTKGVRPKLAARLATLGLGSVT